MIKPDLAERNRQRATHGHTRAGHHTSEWIAWRSMVQRCGPASKDAGRYFARGIAVCQRWLRFENFLADMGHRPSPAHSLDRIDNDKGYEPGNVRWATAKEQARNRRSSVFVSHGGVVVTIAEWAERTGLPRKTIEWRIRRGWPAHEALTTAPDKANRWRER